MKNRIFNFKGQKSSVFYRSNGGVSKRKETDIMIDFRHGLDGGCAFYVFMQGKNIGMHIHAPSLRPRHRLYSQRADNGGNRRADDLQYGLPSLFTHFHNSIVDNG